MINYKELTEQICLVAEKGAEFIAQERKVFSSDKIETKSGDNDLVSYVDKQTEKLVVEALKPLIKGARFITEEKTPIEGVDESSPFCWVIDPLDGTTNFAHNLAPYCVSIALMEGEEVVAGVVYIVTTKECFYSWKGGASYLNGAKIEVSSVKTLKESLIATGFSYSNSQEQQEHFMKYSLELMRLTHGFRRTGSAAANLIFVACGRLDGFAQVNLSAWDVAAGVLIAKNSGAVVCDYTKGDNYIFGGELIACNPHIFEEYYTLLENTKQR